MNARRAICVGVVVLWALGAMSFGAPATRRRPSSSPKKTASENKSSSAASRPVQTEPEDGFLLADQTYRNRLSAGVGLGWINVAESGIAIGFSADFARRITDKMPLYVGFEIGGLRWDTHVAAAGESLLDQTTAVAMSPRTLTALMLLPTTYLRYYEKAKYHLIFGLSAGAGWIFENAVSGAADASLSYLRMVALLRVGIEIELDWEFELSQAGTLRIEPRVGLFGDRAFFYPVAQVVLPF